MLWTWLRAFGVALALEAHGVCLVGAHCTAMAFAACVPWQPAPRVALAWEHACLGLATCPWRRALAYAARKLWQPAYGSSFGLRCLGLGRGIKPRPR